MKKLQKNVWGNNIIVILVLLLFWPIGLFFMWKYSAWKKSVKITLSIFFLISLVPIILVGGLIFSLKASTTIKSITTPKIINTSRNYTCMPVDSEWGKCTNLKYHISFNYPLSWHYIDINPEGLGFTPTDSSSIDDLVITFNIDEEMNSNSEAIEFANGGGSSSRKPLRVNGFYATEEEIKYQDKYDFFAVLVDGKRTFRYITFTSNLHEKKTTLDRAMLKSIFDRMLNSFRREE
ncbi:hypothetical protein HGA88_04000 [Candidatus Roizmanbacteria bacterium]|nr:hypothetical protein [Candidatus Roizmanbacteria bacterium]